MLRKYKRLRQAYKTHAEIFTDNAGRSKKSNEFTY